MSSRPLSSSEPPAAVDPAALEQAIAELGAALEAFKMQGVRSPTRPRQLVRTKTGTGKLKAPRAASTEQLAAQDAPPPAPKGSVTRPMSGTGRLIEALGGTDGLSLDGVSLDAPSGTP